jgi:hypothetical protein
MSLIDAIETFNRTGQPRIELRTAADGRVLARLPRLGREVVVRGGGAEVGGPSSQDLAALCEEAQLAIAPGMALLEAGLAAIGRVAREGEGEAA